jgi:hypothetical protein
MLKILYFSKNILDYTNERDVHMSKGKLVLLLCLVVSFALIAVACNDAQEPDPTKKPETTEAPSEGTPTAEPTATPEPTETPEPTPTPIAGKLYEDAEILFEDNFDDNTYAADFLSTFTGDLDIFSDGMLKCYRPAELFNYSPMELDYDSYFQYEFWADVSAWNETNEAKPGTGSWMGVMLGVRVNNPSLNPTSDDGYWVSFSQGDKVLVYPTGSASKGIWPAGKFSVDVGVCFNEPRTIACVDTGKQAFFYVVDKDGNEKLFLRADFDDDGMVRSYDAEGNLLDESQDYSANNMSNHFVLFNHISQATVDNVYVKAK